jgi:hypothetical protein
MRIIFTFFLAFMLTIPVLAQQGSNYWTAISEQQMVLPQSSEVDLSVTAYRTFALDLQGLRQTLRQAPMEFTAEARSAPLTITFPMPDGTTKTMAVVESPVMHPNLAARYPQIRSFKAWDINAPEFKGRFEYSPFGFNAVFESEAGEVFITPYASDQTEYFATYYSKDMILDESLVNFACGTESHEEADIEEILLELELANHRGPGRTGARNTGEPLDLRIYDFALTCTGEFAQQRGNGTLEGVIAVYNTSLNFANNIFENEVGFRLQMIEETENLINLDPVLDPFINANVGTGLLGQIQNAIVEVGGVDFDDYDLGHVFTAGCIDVGGVVSGLACTSGKSRGVTCFSSNNIIGVTRRVMVHEVGHQFTAAHTWNNCPPSLEQLATGSAFEPGSGSTIMSYAGTCENDEFTQPNNAQNFNDAYYHVKSLEDMIAFTRENIADACATKVPTANTIPTISLDYEDGFYIPISTPFELTAEATDLEGDDVTYCWEQFNLGPVSNLGNPFGDAPIFRSFPPTSSPTRTIPRLSALLANESEIIEVLPTYSRDLKFRCTVRDNNEEVGAASWDLVDFEATNTAGPFLVQGPNTGNEEWQAGDYVEVTWDVANTTNSLVNCQFVNILLSVDGGFTYPFTLATNAQNDGSEFVTVPDITSNNLARVKVEAADNIFFDISNENFDIVPATEPGFALTNTPSYQQVCLPANAVVELSTFALLDFNNSIQFEITDGLPNGATPNFSANDILPSESSTLEIDMSGVTEAGLYEVTLQASAEGAETIIRTFLFEVVVNDFSDLSLNNPPDGTEGIILSTDFDWIPTTNALTYDFQVANDASFAPSTIIDSGSGLTNPDFGLSVLLDENDIFYWRVRPVNECGPGPWEEAHTFQTTAVDCAEYEASDVPIPISGSGLPEIESTIFVAESGIINDINIPLISGSYQPVNSLRITLIKDDIEVILFNRNCGNTVNFDIGFDDDAPQDIQCPPDDGIVFRPEEALSAFIGQNTFGEWTLRVKVVTGGFGGGGGLDNWSIEFCSTIANDNPSLITNDTLFVPPGEANVITPAELEVQDGNYSPSDIEFNIITPPAHGTLFRNTDPLGSAGEDFFQATINASNLIYVHDGSDTEFDSFTFLVENPEGGWIVPQTFNIRITDGAVVDVEEVLFEESNVVLYPNPASSQLFVAFDKLMDQDVDMQLFNVQGQLLQQANRFVVGNQIQVDISSLPAGVYLLSLRTEEGMVTKRFSVQR